MRTVLPKEKMQDTMWWIWQPASLTKFEIRQILDVWCADRNAERALAYGVDSKCNGGLRALEKLTLRPHLCQHCTEQTWLPQDCQCHQVLYGCWLVLLWWHADGLPCWLLHLHYFKVFRVSLGWSNYKYYHWTILYFAMTILSFSPWSINLCVYWWPAKHLVLGHALIPHRKGMDWVLNCPC